MDVMFRIKDGYVDCSMSTSGFSISAMRSTCIELPASLYF